MKNSLMLFEIHTFWIILWPFDYLFINEKNRHLGWKNDRFVIFSLLKFGDRFVVVTLTKPKKGSLTKLFVIIFVNGVITIGMNKQLRGKN